MLLVDLVVLLWFAFLFYCLFCFDVFGSTCVLTTNNGVYVLFFLHERCVQIHINMYINVYTNMYTSVS